MYILYIHSITTYANISYMHIYIYTYIYIYNIYICTYINIYVYIYIYTCFFRSNTFINNISLKLTKNSAKVQQSFMHIFITFLVVIEEKIIASS